VPQFPQNREITAMPLGEVMPALRFTLRDTKILEPDRHVQHERAAGLALAIGAVSGVEQQRKRRDLVAGSRRIGSHRSSGAKVAALSWSGPDANALAS